MVRPRRSVTVSFHGANLSVTVTKKAVEVDEWINNTIRNHCHHLRDLIVGLDIEWHPNTSGDFKPPAPAATLQLCVGQRCLIFQLLHRDFIPDSLLNFLAYPFFTFVGVGVQDDAEKLFRDHGLIVRKVVDLRHLAAWVYDSKEFSRMGLKRIALEVLGQVMEKPLEVTLSDWDAKDLTYRQIEYGSIDAFASFQIGFDLFTMAAYKLHLLNGNKAKEIQLTPESTLRNTNNTYNLLLISSFQHRKEVAEQISSSMAMKKIMPDQIYIHGADQGLHAERLRSLKASFKGIKTIYAQDK
nr:Werner Syndrome-like exonuclease [Ipomoea batatas]